MNPRPLETLTELAREARNKAAQLLSGERQNQQRLAQQVEVLREYRQEYAQQLQLRMDQGIGLAALQDYQNFLASLDSAIKHARDSLQEQQDTVVLCQEQWRHKQRRLSSFDTLASRRREQELQESRRQEMRQQDEISSNLFFRNSNGSQGQ